MRHLENCVRYALERARLACKQLSLINYAAAIDASDSIDIAGFGYKMSKSLVDLSLHLNHQFVFPSTGA